MVHARKALLVLTFGAVLLVTVALSLSSTFAGNWGGRDRAPGGVLIGSAAPVPAPLLAENERKPHETIAPTATPSATLEANGQQAGTPVPSATPPPPPTATPQTATATPTTGATATVTSTPTPSPTATAPPEDTPTPTPTPHDGVKPLPPLLKPGPPVPPNEDLLDGVTDRKQLDCPKERPPRRPVDMSKHDWKKKLKWCGIDEEGNPLVAGSPAPGAATTFTVTGAFAAVY